MTGIGRAVELLLRALAERPPPGRWVLWSRGPLGPLAWPGTEEHIDGADPRRWAGLGGVRRRPGHDVAIYPSQIRPPGRRPTVQLLYDATPIRSETRLLPRLAKREYFRRLGSATVVLVCSSTAADDLTRLVGLERSRVRVYAYPVDEAFGAAVRKRRAETGTRPELLFVGRPAPHKNLERLVAAHMDSTWATVGTLVLVGPGTELFAGRHPSVVALGEVDDASLIERFASARALVLPSLMEGFGLPVLEAQVAGLPVLASDRPPLTDLVDDEWDVTFDPEDVGAIRAALDALAAGGLHEPGPRPVAGSTFADYRDCVVDAVVDALRTG